MIGRLKVLGAEQIDLAEIYIKHVWSILELEIPAWQGAITQAEHLELEPAQKSALHIILGDKYECYDKVFKVTKL